MVFYQRIPGRISQIDSFWIPFFRFSLFRLFYLIRGGSFEWRQGIKNSCLFLTTLGTTSKEFFLLTRQHLISFLRLLFGIEKITQFCVIVDINFFSLSLLIIRIFLFFDFFGFLMQMLFFTIKNASDHWEFLLKSLIYLSIHGLLSKKIVTIDWFLLTNSMSSIFSLNHDCWCKMHFNKNNYWCSRQC